MSGKTGEDGSERDVGSDENGSSPPRQQLALGQCIGLTLCLLVFIVISLVIWWYGPMKLLRDVLLLVPRKPGWDWWIAMCLLTTVSITLLMPIWPPLCMAAGLLFGFGWGCLHNFCAIFTAACLSLMLGRVLLREPVRAWLEQGDQVTLRRFMAVLEEEEDSLKLQVLFRFLFIPMFLRNYVPSTLQIPLYKLMLAAIPHSVWISILFASLGSTFTDVAQVIRDGKEMDWKHLKWQQGLIMVVSGIVAIVLAIYAHYKYQEYLEQNKESEALIAGSQRERSGEA